jgi:hypothetical protein
MKLNARAIAEQALVIARIQSGKLLPIETGAMALMTNDWKDQPTFGKFVGALHDLVMAHVVDYQVVDYHFAQGENPSVGLKNDSQQGTDGFMQQYRLKLS